ncbi:efflux RND transporter periplasmic adaptor subunit [Salinisphaera hydrothermalis]|uniref:RND family efflux transporter MFP subunit n=1 Tax=Salinisphaera hydrothermalis (strain C41B8) TaxID=1304275 RepID=A0A084IR39_SALHC|nr:efflux RND transporter periplasmic adaptor subunit [Salinisphaera hydrothermalis]KEZ79173.1 RND family efflux transporter MFP subunit [Salinisphaera hydrothermalis C41B8]
MRNNDYEASRGALALRALIVLSATVVLAACGQGSGGGQAQAKTPPTPVHAVKVEPHSVDVYAEYPGRVQGKQTAKVIGRVTGILESKNYDEGSIVHKGDLLFKIDPKPYQATVDQRKAQLASARAALSNSSRIWKRTRKLYKANAVSQAERDQALSTYQSDQAAVQQAKANLESAQIDLNYTRVKAPITGVTSLRDVDLGSLVQANQTQLTTITQLDPVYVLFALPEDDAFARQKALSEMGKQSSDEATREATIILNNGQDFPYKADVDFTQSTIDPDTGTVRLRAIVKNPHNQLMPGRYVRVRLRIQTLQHAITVPEAAIASGQQTQVFVVENGKAKAVAVKLGPNTAQGQVITDGLKAGDQVVTSGLGTLKSGAPVKVKQDQQSNAGSPADKGGHGNADQQDSTSSADDGSSQHNG